jgi:Putative bacterial sensory transduction regulator
VSRPGSDADPDRVAAPDPAGAPRPGGLPDHDAALGQILAGLDVSYESPRPGSYLVKLPGQHKLQTMAWLIAGAHSLHVEAFFCRQPDENHAEFYRFLLEHNSGMYGVHFALDPVGDVYLVGRLPLTAIAAEEIDRVLGCVLTYADEIFDQALMLGFASAIRKEYAWRVKRGESLANLQAFGRITETVDDADRADGPRLNARPTD